MSLESTEKRAKKLVAYMEEKCSFPPDTPESLLPKNLELVIERTLAEMEASIQDKKSLNDQ